MVSTHSKTRRRSNKRNDTSEPLMRSEKSALKLGRLVLLLDTCSGQKSRNMNFQCILQTTWPIFSIWTPQPRLLQIVDGIILRSRPPTSEAHLLKWQVSEKKQLRKLCREHSILFLSVRFDQTLQEKVMKLLLDFRYGSEIFNLFCVEHRLDEIGL